MRFSTDELAACKRYMRDDETGTTHDEDIDALMAAAEEYLNSAGIRTSSSPRFRLALHNLTLYYYDHRDQTGEAQLPVGLRHIINQLKVDNEIGAAE